MKQIKVLSLIGILIVAASCKKEVQLSDLAIQAMERAKVFEADIYAPQEYAIAEENFNKMNEALSQGNQNLANELAPAVVDAANKAIEVSKSIKATTLIAELKQSLDIASRLGLDVERPDIFAQATQSLIDAQSFYEEPDYEKAAIAAQEGLDTINSLIGGTESLALANLNRARELLDRAYKTTDLFYTEELLKENADLIERAASEYQNGEYFNSIKSSQEAIDDLNELMALYPNDASISITVNQDDNLQLQAYDLLRQLEEVLTYIKNEYGAVAFPETSEERPVAPLTPEEEGFVPTEETEEAKEESKAVESSEATESAEEESKAVESSEATEEEGFVPTESAEATEKANESSNSGAVELILYNENENLHYMPLVFKAQVIEITNTAQESPETTVVTIQMIEDAYNDAQKYYDETSYLNSIDRSREGLRLAEIFLANQTLKMHKVIKGDTLWDISKDSYKTPWLWPNIWRANKLIIKDPDLIYVDQEFKIPPAPKN